MCGCGSGRLHGVSPPTFPCSRLCFLSLLPWGWAPGGLNSRSSSLASVFVYVSTRRCLTTDFLLTPGNREKTKPQQLSLLKTQNCLLCLISPDGGALFLLATPGQGVSGGQSHRQTVGWEQATCWGAGPRAPGACITGWRGSRETLTDQGALTCPKIPLTSPSHQLWFQSTCLVYFFIPLVSGLLISAIGQFPFCAFLFCWLIFLIPYDAYSAPLFLVFLL